MTARVELRDGTTIPQVGFGTFQVPPDSSGSERDSASAAAVVGQAIDVGYRHFDTAQTYGNEVGVGRGIANSGVARDDIYVTSKLSNAHHSADTVRRSFQETLAKVGVDRLDLFLIHWPVPTLYGGDFSATWRAVTELRDDGRLRSAGVSNFQPRHLRQIVDDVGVAPVINQVEIHPYFHNTSVRAACTELGVAIAAWSPLGQGSVLDDETIGSIAVRHGCTPAQVVLRWHLQHSRIVVPKTVRPDRMAQNLDVGAVDLTPSDMDAIDGLDRGEAGRIGPHPDTFDWVPS